MTLVTISPDDLDKAERIPAAQALAGLAQVHQLPRLDHVIATQVDGRTVLNIAVPEAIAEQWRAALGAAPFTAVPQPEHTQHKTSVFWCLATVNLTYATL
jgi:hypothetical protein